IFFLIANNFTWIPFVEAIIHRETGTPIFTNPSAHYSLPIAMTLLTLGISHFIALSVSPLRHIGNYIKIKPLFQSVLSLSPQKIFMETIHFLIGLLDIVSELAKLISLSTRLFGNIFAGGIVIMIISTVSIYTQYII